jgi:hypothetical protein
MALDATQVRSGLTGNLYQAPVGTTMPTDTSTALAAAWIELGYVSEDGLTITPSTEVEDIGAWQSLYPVRSVVTGRSLVTSFSLIQRNTVNLELAFGGGVVAVASLTSTYSPPTSATVYERAYVFQVNDGTIVDRWLLYRGFPTISGDITFKTDEAAAYSMEIRTLPDTAGLTWKLLSSDTTNLVAG